METHFLQAWTDAEKENINGVMTSRGYAELPDQAEGWYHDDRRQIAVWVTDCFYESLKRYERLFSTDSKFVSQPKYAIEADLRLNSLMYKQSKVSIDDLIQELREIRDEIAKTDKIHLVELFIAEKDKGYPARARNID